jgi:hypothetical protein
VCIAHNKINLPFLYFIYASTKASNAITKQEINGCIFCLKMIQKIVGLHGKNIFIFFKKTLKKSKKGRKISKFSFFAQF